MTEGPRVNSVMREALFEIYTWVLCLSYLHENKQVEFNPYIYALSKLSRFGYEISVFKYTPGWYSEQPPEQPAHTSRQQLHGNVSYVHRSRKHLECKYFEYKSILNMQHRIKNFKYALWDINKCFQNLILKCQTPRCDSGV